MIYGTVNENGDYIGPQLEHVQAGPDAAHLWQARHLQVQPQPGNKGPPDPLVLCHRGRFRWALLNLYYISYIQCTVESVVFSGVFLFHYPGQTGHKGTCGTVRISANSGTGTRNLKNPGPGTGPRDRKFSGTVSRSHADLWSSRTAV